MTGWLPEWRWARTRVRIRGCTNCRPFGDFTADTVELVRRAGYTSAVTVLPGVARASDDRLRLPRILVNGERGLWNFLLHVATPYERLRRQWRRRAP
jgi:hypothetical protein